MDKNIEVIENTENTENTENAEEIKKIAKPIVIIRDVLKKIELPTDKKRHIPRQVLKRFIHFVENITDKRCAGMIKYPMSYILVITFLAVLSGADGWTEIEDFAKTYRKTLSRALPKYYGAPSHDTFRRVLGLLAIGELAQAVTDFLVQSMEEIKKGLGIKEKGYRLINIDGKESRGTGRKYNTDEKVHNLQTLNVYDASNAICLTSIPIENKTNEIPLAQEFLKQMQLKNTIVTFDAMNTQYKTISSICANKGDYVGGLKGNQHLFYEDVVLYFSENELTNIRHEEQKRQERHKKQGKPGIAENDCFYTYTEKAHNRIEKRSYYLTRDISWFADLDKWAKLKSFVCYIFETEHLVTGKKTIEYHYYITSLTKIDLIADAIRSHWSIENQLHWHLDYPRSFVIREECINVLSKQHCA